MSRPEFAHMADAYRRLAESFDRSGQAEIADVYRVVADAIAAATCTPEELELLRPPDAWAVTAEPCPASGPTT